MEGQAADDAQARYYFSQLGGAELERAFAYELDKLCRTLGLDVRGAVDVRVAPPQASRSFVTVTAPQPAGASATDDITAGHMFTTPGGDCTRCGCKWMHRYGLRCKS